MTSQTLEALARVVHDNGGPVSETLTIPPKQARRANIPSELHADVRNRLAALYPEGLYCHQTLGMSLGLEGRSVCVATPTASGKTVIFTSIAISALLNNPGTVVLALYPAKALIHDQETKWRAATKGTDISVAIIHGGISRDLRVGLLKVNRIMLMTPDVLHAWLLAKINDPEIQRFLAALRLVILDEAHIYDGVFGTNMAYLMRRLRTVSGVNQIVASSATVGEPALFLKHLTGFDFDLVGRQEDGTATAAKHVLLCQISPRAMETFVKGLVKELRQRSISRFIMFVDSRRKVEELASSIMRSSDITCDEPEAVTDGEEVMDADLVLEQAARYAVLPYRAGYEEVDRAAIQAALTNGQLGGVLSTSALELGIDIGEIGLVVNLGAPPTIKSFWQRAGRCGRTDVGCVLLVDMDGQISAMGLSRYLEQTPELNWLYMDNEYLQYANALCAADEYQQAAQALYSPKALTDLPENFRALLENEITPTRSIPHELYPLKQQALATGDPHVAFPVRTGVEKSYKVESPHMPNQGLGSLTYSQVLREAFPGALYRYMGRPYRVWSLRHGQGKIIAKRVHLRGITRPISQTMVFPQFADEMFYLAKSQSAFICESKIQVSSRLVGFMEQYGSNKIEVRYELGCPYAQKALTNYYDTTGVCFFFPDEDLQREALGRYIAGACCRICAVRDRDIAVGRFISSNISPMGQGQIKGFAVFDTTVGSLRLTRQIPARLGEILQEGIRIAKDEGANKVAADLELMKEHIAELREQEVGTLANTVFESGSDDGWVTVVSPNQNAICHDGVSHIHEEVLVLGYLFTPQGITYKLRHPKDGVQWQVAANMIHPVNGVTQCEQYNVNSGEVRLIL